jgi:hypothetical protein
MTQSATPNVGDASVNQRWERPVDQWQPIETAPKDGTFVDLWGVKSTDARLRPADMRARRFPDCRWRRPVEGYAGDFDCDWFEAGEVNPVRPTHWMPPPKPPSVRAP